MNKEAVLKLLSIQFMNLRETTDELEQIFELILKHHIIDEKEVKHDNN